VNPGDGSLDPSVAGANWCDESYPNQSPIDVQDDLMVPTYVTKPLNVEPLTVASTNMVLTSNGVELELEGEWLALEYMGNKYTASQLHFHSPSEHVFNGMHCAGEMHVVCNNDDESIASADGPHGHAVLAFCLEMGTNVNPFFAKVETLLASLPDGPDSIQPGFVSAPLLGWNFDSFKPQLAGDYAYYLGSYTTPACNPNIDWFMIQEPVHVSVNLIEFMQERFKQPANHRPLQAMTGRTLTFYHVCDCSHIEHDSDCDAQERRFRRLLFASGVGSVPSASGCERACRRR